MSFGTILYTLLIKPLELVFEIIYSMANELILNPGLSIVALSLTMNFLVLPLYMRADAMQAEEQDVEKKLQSWTSHIKKTFKGDERFMMLQAYYRLNDYKPTYALRGSFSLLLEIPFFIAAYHFLSHLELIKGVSFGPIIDLGAPDGLIKVGEVAVNLLPILMTVINIISGAIYTKGSTIKTKIQLYAMALVFLVFLYKSPSGLVFYWTLNNLFSLLKNVFYKLKNPRKVISVMASYAGAMLCGISFTKSEFSMRQKAFLILFSALLQIPILLQYIKLPHRERTATSELKPNAVFILSALFIAILIGFVIPSAVIAASTDEFVDVIALNNPLKYIVYSSLLSVGLFVIWIGIFYYLTDKKGKIIFAGVILSLGVIFIVDYMLFGRNLGNLSPQLQFDNSPHFAIKEVLLNCLAIIGIVFVCQLVYRKANKVVIPIILAGIVALIAMGIKNTNAINKEYVEVVKISNQENDLPTYNFSKNGKNVVVIMMDRMISYYIPYMMYEKPELYSMFDGFTYYPNSATYGRKTNAATPSLYGGYEYIPTELNKRDTETLGEKQNEALKVMPVLFDENDYDVTVCDPTYADYSWTPNTGIYDDYPDIKAYNTMGRIGFNQINFDNMEKILCRDFFCYSVMKSAPVVVQKSIYNNGNYYSTVKYEEMGAAGQVANGLSQSNGLDSAFMNSYNVLNAMSAMSRIEESSQNYFLMMSNDLTHAPCILQEPEYIPAPVIDNTEFDEKNHVKYAEDGSCIDIADEINTPHYQVNMAAMLKLGEWFDYLRDNGVWDNTKIIIVSDHGYEIGLDENMMVWGKLGDTEDHLFDMTELQCTLLVKDFDSTGFSVSDDFMTEADVPTLALDKCIENPKNPFTGNPIENIEKENGVKSLFVHNWDITQNNGTTFMPEEWFYVHDNIFINDNWKYLGYY